MCIIYSTWCIQRKLYFEKQTNLFKSLWRRLYAVTRRDVSQSRSCANACHSFLFIMTAVTFLSLWHWGHRGTYHVLGPLASHFVQLISQRSAALFCCYVMTFLYVLDDPSAFTHSTCAWWRLFTLRLHFYQQLERIKKLWPKSTGTAAILPAAKAEIKEILIWVKFDKEKREPGQSSVSFSQSGRMRLLKPLRGITFVFSVSFSDSSWDLWTVVILRKPSFTFFPSSFLGLCMTFLFGERAAEGLCIWTIWFGNKPTRSAEVEF